MAGMWIKRSSWSTVKNMWIRTTVGWSPVRSGYIKRSTSWSRFWFKANLPNEITKPRFNTTNNSGSGTIYDGPTAGTPQFINENLYGKDGTYSNYTSITGRKISRGDTLTADINSRTDIVTSDLFTSGGGVTTADRTAVDGKYLFYEMSVKNGTDPLNTVNSISNGIKMIKSYPALTNMGWTGAEQIGTALTLNYTIENYYYNKIDPALSYVRWWRSSTTNASGTLLKEQTITATSTGATSTSRTGTSSYTPVSADGGYYIVAEITGRSSYTEHYGYTDNYSMGSFPTGGVISTPLVVSGVNFTDLNGRTGKNARGNLVTATSTRLNWTVTGVNTATTFRVRYRILNNQNGLYYNPNNPTTSLAAGSAWLSYTDNYNDTGTISSVSINGTTATLYDDFTIDSTFNGSTYGGGISRWSFQYELSVVSSSGTRSYWVYPNSMSTSQANDYWDIDPTTNPSIAASSTSIATGGSVTFTGTFNSYPASLSSYPHSYRINYGDNTDSGWISLSSGTANQSYSQSHIYNSAGSYSAYVETTPSYTTNYAYITAANAPTTPTNLSGYANGSGATQSITLNWNATSDANTYELFFNGNGSAPTDYQTYADYRGITTNTYTTPVIFSASNTYYWWVRGKSSAGTFSPWSSIASVTTNAQVVKLSTPSGVSATTTRTDGVNITWNAVSGASYYGVWYGGAPGYDYLADFGGNRNTSLITGTSYLDTSIGAGSSRDYYVQAYKSGDPTGTKSDWSSVANGTRANPVVNLDPPIIYNVIKSGSSYLVYFYSGSGPAYQVWWQGSAGTPSTTSYDASGSSSPISVTNLTASAGSTYYFSARSVSSAGNTGSGPSASISSWSGQYSYTEPSAPSTPAPVLSSLTGNNSLALGGTFNWSFTNSPTSYSILVTGPSGTVYTTSNSYSYYSTSFRPGYDGSGWQGAGNYTIYVNATNGQNSSTASLTTYMN